MCGTVFFSSHIWSLTQWSRHTRRKVELLRIRRNRQFSHRSMLRSVVGTPAAAAVVLELVWPCLAAVHLVQSVRYHQSTSRRTVFANARRTKQRRLHQLHDSPSKRSLSQLVGYFSDGEVSVVIILYEFLEYFYWLVFFTKSLRIFRRSNGPVFLYLQCV